MEREQERLMPLEGHLEELRNRLLISIFAILVLSILSFIFVKPIFEFLLLPLGGEKLVFTRPAEGFATLVKVALVSGLILSSPVLLYQVWAFVAPALYPHERRIFYLYFFPALLLFIAGAGFGYLVLVPLTLKFLLNFGRDLMSPLISTAAYLGFILWMIVACGVIFEAPLLSYIFSRIGLLSPDFLASRWKWIIVGIFILAGVLTPSPDIFSQLALAIPLLILYVLSYFISRLAYPHKRR